MSGCRNLAKSELPLATSTFTWTTGTTKFKFSTCTKFSYWVTRNSKFWSILFFAFRFNFNMSQDPDSMQSPEQVSDFDGDAWFLSSRRLEFVSVQCILYEPPYILVF